MKYLVFRVGDRDIPILFPEELVHAQVADRLKTLLQFNRATLVSAGEAHGVYVASTSGSSESLNLPARAEDAEMMNVYDYCKGMWNPNQEKIAGMIREAHRRALDRPGATTREDV